MTCVRLHGQPKDLSQIPRQLRPKLPKSTQVDLALAHLMNIDTVVHGRGDEDLLWQMIGGVLTWYRVAICLKLGEPEMLAQIQLLAGVITRYGRTGSVAFTGDEYRLAVAGCTQMELLASAVDQLTAIQAAEWSESQLKIMAEGIEAQRRELEVAH